MLSNARLKWKTVIKIDHTLRRGAAWNTVFGLISAGQSALILVFLTRYVGVQEAGLFSIAYATANLVNTIALYGMRTYQVTDIREKYGFQHYFSCRCITFAGTLVLLCGYLAQKCARQIYDPEKAIVVLMLCLWKLVFCMEDVFYGMYQQRGRLDIGAKYAAIRAGGSTALFCVLSLLGMPLIHSSCLVVLWSGISAFYFIRKTFAPFGEKIQFTIERKTISLLRECFPLCISTGLLMYLSNIPKFMIDSYLDTEVQAVFGYLMMPAFVVLLFSKFCYVPFVRGMGEQWSKGIRKAFLKTAVFHCTLIAVLTAIACAAGYFLGLPILSWIYHVPLQIYRPTFMVLLVGGGLNAMVNFLMVPLTTTRFYRCVTLGAAIMAGAGYFLGRIMTVSYGILGAALLYVVINGGMLLFLAASLLYRVLLKKDGSQ